MVNVPNCIREYPAIGKYRIRLMEYKERRVLDIREYIETDMFEGFTRRGIKLPIGDLVQLSAILSEIERGRL